MAYTEKAGHIPLRLIRISAKDGGADGKLPGGRESGVVEELGGILMTYY